LVTHQRKRRKQKTLVLPKKELWKFVGDIFSGVTQIPTEMEKDKEMNIFFVDKETWKVIPHLVHPTTLANFQLHYGTYNFQRDANVLAGMAGEKEKWDVVMAKQHFYIGEEYYSIISSSEKTLFASWKDKHIVICQLHYLFLVVSDNVSRLNTVVPNSDKYEWSAYRFLTESEKLAEELRNSGL